MTINAFHPDYIRTYHPDFLTAIRVDSRQAKSGQALTNHISKVRKTKPSHGTVFGISNKVVSVTPIPDMAPRDFHIYQKAGMPKKTKSQQLTEAVARKRQTNKNYGTMFPNSKNIPKNIPKGV